MLSVRLLTSPVFIICTFSLSPHTSSRTDQPRLGPSRRRRLSVFRPPSPSEMAALMLLAALRFMLLVLTADWLSPRPLIMSPSSLSLALILFF